MKLPNYLTKKIKPGGEQYTPEEEASAVKFLGRFVLMLFAGLVLFVFYNIFLTGPVDSNDALIFSYWIYTLLFFIPFFLVFKKTGNRRIIFVYYALTLIPMLFILIFLRITGGWLVVISILGTGYNSLRKVGKALEKET